MGPSEKADQVCADFEFLRSVASCGGMFEKTREFSIFLFQQNMTFLEELAGLAVSPADQTKTESLVLKSYQYVRATSCLGGDAIDPANQGLLRGLMDFTSDLHDILVARYLSDATRSRRAEWLELTASIVPYQMSFGNVPQQ